VGSGEFLEFLAGDGEDGMGCACGSPDGVEAEEGLVKEFGADVVASVGDGGDAADGKAGALADFVGVGDADGAGLEEAGDFEGVGAAVASDEGEDGVALVEDKDEGFDDLSELTTDGIGSELGGAGGVGEFVDLDVEGVGAKVVAYAVYGFGHG